MTHLDSNTLATYNSLIDPHLQCYFSNERIRTHLRHAGLISRRGEIVPDSEYRLKLARREHKKHVRQMLAENIVHRAVDMERTRQAELNRQLDVVAKAALVNSVKESRRRGGHSLGNLTNSNEMGGISMQSSWSATRPKSASHQRELEIMTEEIAERPRIQSAKHSSKSPSRRSRYLNRPKSSSVHRSSPTHPRASIKPSDSSLSNPPCQITMIYYGPHTKIDYDHSLFEPIDEILVMQQHCGGENLIVYKDHLKAGDEFTFNSRRHQDYPFGLSIYVKGLIDSRISTCCEYKHRHGVRLGGERGHFAIVSVQGSKACLKCRFDKQSRLKQYEDANEIDDETKKPITISIPASDLAKNKQIPVKIPVRQTPESNEDYSEDFDATDQVDKTREVKSSFPSNFFPSKSPTETSSTSTLKSKETTTTKTWQMIFHTSNIPTGSLNLPKNPSINAVLKIFFLSINGTEQHQIPLKDFPQYFKSGRHDSLPIKLRNIGQPKEIRLKLEVTGHEQETIKWHLDHIELIDPETQFHSKFLCNQWIHPFEEILLQQTTLRKTSTSTTTSKSSIGKKSRSSSSSYESPKRFELIPKSIRRISTDNESLDRKDQIHYRISIYPSNKTDGEFNPSNDSRIYLRLNNQNKDSFLYKKGTKICPTFQSGEQQTFEIDLKQNLHEQPTKLTMGYYNTDITASKWKIQKIILVNSETGEETSFSSKEPLIRNDFNLRAEGIFHVQSDEEETTPRNLNTTKGVSLPRGNNEDIPLTTKNESQSSSSPSVTDHTDEDNRPKTRRGRDETLKNNQEEMWRPSSELEKTNLVDPLHGLDELQQPTARSNPPKDSTSNSENTEDLFKDWYSKEED